LNFERSQIDIETIYKRYALLYDRVIFNRHGCPIGKGDLFSNLPSYIACTAANRQDRKEGLSLARNNQFKDIFIDMWDLFENPETMHQRASDYLDPKIVNKISKFSWLRNELDEKMGLHNHHKEYKAASIVDSDISSDLAFNLMLADKIDDFNISLPPVIGEAIKSVNKVNEELNLFTTDLLFPDFESLSWDQILELRQDKYIASFRKKVFSSIGQGLHVDKTLHESLDKDLWYLAEQCKPNIGSRLIELVLSNIPLSIPINPVSCFFGGKALIQDIKNKEKSWVFVIQSMRKLR